MRGVRFCKRKLHDFLMREVRFCKRKLHDFLMREERCRKRKLHDFWVHGERDSKVVWQSFDVPSDTILGDQQLRPEQRLVSRKSNFQMRMQQDGNLEIYEDNHALY
ncbi:hypothetical protein IFM89_021043 [Coptis chinensis]|uniref:Uncharacterized protein n=1 Tax=Coptis chinensis TaxID=261450 RepID=A0A835LI31_9MAGN|nr:hypothetical protein IFM89_021043 [Coptis chinensis]